MTDSQVLTPTTDTSAEVEPLPGQGEILLSRLRFTAGMAVAATIFWYVGWEVARPTDPCGPVSLLMVDQGVTAMAQLLGLAIVCSGLAVAICGAGSADRGPLAIAVGLAALGLRGTQLDMLVLYRLNPPIGTDGAVDPFPTTALVAECWLWLALIAVGFVVGRWVESWFTPRAPSQEQRAAEDHSPDVRRGMGAVIVASLVAWSVLTFTLGTSADVLDKGQIYFGVGFSFLAAGLIAHWFFRVSSRIWSLIVVAVVASAAYLVTGPDSETIRHAGEQGLYLNLAPFARPLPLEYAALGAVGALWERDWMHTLRAWFTWD